MQFVATIAVVASVLVFAYQARELAHQSRVGNEVAGTQAHREIFLHYKRFTDVFIRYPELHAYYYDQTPNTPSANDSVRLRVIADQHADWLDAALITTRQLASYEYTGMSATWDDYVTSTVGSSSILRSIIRDTRDWPSLDPFLSRYDESQTARPEGASLRATGPSLQRPPLTSATATRNHRTPAASTPGRTRLATPAARASAPRATRPGRRADLPGTQARPHVPLASGRRRRAPGRQPS